MTSEGGSCKPIILQGNCLVYKRIPPLPRSAIAAARKVGMAKTAQELLKLRRVLIYYKNAPCVVCNSSDGNAIPQLATVPSQVSDTARSEHHALLHAAMSNSNDFELPGFVLSSPGNEPVVMDFTIQNAWLFLKTRFSGMFGGKTLAVTCKRISSRIDKTLADIKQALLEVEVDAAAKPDLPRAAK